jgi:hypothetical protein
MRTSSFVQQEQQKEIRGVQISHNPVSLAGLALVSTQCLWSWYDMLSEGTVLYSGHSVSGMRFT